MNRIFSVFEIAGVRIRVVTRMVVVVIGFFEEFWIDANRNNRHLCIFADEIGICRNRLCECFRLKKTTTQYCVLPYSDGRIKNRRQAIGDTPVLSTADSSRRIYNGWLYGYGFRVKARFCFDWNFLA